MSEGTVSPVGGGKSSGAEKKRDSSRPMVFSVLERGKQDLEGGPKFSKQSPRG